MPRKKWRRYLFWAVAIILFVLIETVLYRSYLRMTVIANGEALVLRKGSTLKEALHLKNIPLKRGDLFSLEGNLVRKGKGDFPLILLNGRKAALVDQLKEGDQISVHSGQDLYEKVLKKIEVIPPLLVVRGTGAFVSVYKRGLPGLKEVAFGARSKKVLSEKIIKEPSSTIIQRFDKLSPKIALTFDDGPSPLTLQILSILQTKNVPATFFVVGEYIRRHPEVLREVTQAGYEIGNHTFSHSLLSQASYQEIVRELGRNEGLIREITGKKSHWFRPPGGKFSSLLLDTAAGKGYNFVLWSVDPNDWIQSNFSLIQSQVVEKAKPGSVILLHDGGGDQWGTVLALPGIIDALRARGYTFVSLDELYASS